MTNEFNPDGFLNLDREIPMPYLLKTIDEVNHQRALRWHNSPDGLTDWSLNDWLVATLGELGEAANVAKKIRRAECGFQQKKEDISLLPEKLAEELADTFLYLLLTARRANIDLEAAVIKKFNAVSEREGFPERL